MNDEYKDFLDGRIEGNNALCGLTIADNMKPVKIDFVRYLSILSQYKIQGNGSNVLKYYSSYASRESFYADYVAKIVGLEQESHEEKFNECEVTNVFPDDCWKERFSKLKENILVLKSLLKKDTKKNKADFESWIDADYYLFGLIFFVLFKNEKIKLTSNELLDMLKSKIQEKRDDNSYSKSPNRLGNLRERLQESIDIYSRNLEEKLDDE